MGGSPDTVRVPGGRINPKPIRVRSATVLNRPFPIDELTRLTFLSELRDARKAGLLRAQLERAAANFRDKVKCSSQFERAFMKMFKMQVEISQDDFDRLEPRFQIRFLCFFFCNFVDKILVLHFFGDFWPEERIYQEFKTVQTK